MAEQFDPHVIPPGKAAGCLFRERPFGQCGHVFADKIEVVPIEKWSRLLPSHTGLRSLVLDIFDQNGIGCHDETTEVLTETGWQRWSNYDQTSALGTINPQSHALEFQQPTALHAYEYNGPMHVVEHRSTSWCVTPNHRMYLRGWNERERRINDFYDIVSADSIGWYARMLAAPRGFAGADVEYVTVGERRFSGDDFVALVALVASDGWAGGSESTWDRVSFCCFRNDRLGFVRPFAQRLGVAEYPKRPGVFDMRHVPELAAWFRGNMFTENTYRSPYKRVPLIVKCASSRQVELFLRYYGDQHISNSGQRQFYTSSKQMADDLQELLLHVGRRSGICEHQPRGCQFKDGRTIDAANCHTAYTVTEWTTDHMSVEKKKVQVEPYKGMVYCATVPNSLLVTRRDDKMLISGNSCAAEATAQALQLSRAFAGRPWIQLSPWSLYHLSSGGRDQGSNIDTNLEYARSHGIASMAVWPRSNSFRKRLSDAAIADALRYRADEFFDIATVEEFGSALLCGMPVVYGSSGHAKCAVELLDEESFLYANSWDESWGDNGFGVERFKRGVNWGYGAWAIRTAIDAGQAT